MRKWDDLITQFVKHLVDRYGMDEVAQLVLRSVERAEPRLLDGAPRQKTYFELYDHTARDIKAVSPRLRVGGPATAQAAWVAAMIKHADAGHVPARFRLHPRLRQRQGRAMSSTPTKTFRATRWFAAR